MEHKNIGISSFFRRGGVGLFSIFYEKDISSNYVSWDSGGIEEGKNINN
jgi:hypothetical protein